MQGAHRAWVPPADWEGPGSHQHGQREMRGSRGLAALLRLGAGALTACVFLLSPARLPGLQGMREVKVYSLPRTSCLYRQDEGSPWANRVFVLYNTELGVSGRGTQ